jgi:uncharacterized protein (DUF4415 family)
MSCGQFNYAEPQNRKGRFMPKTPLKPNVTDWERVKREAASNAPVEDPLGPYDPQDAVAVSNHWKAATLTRGRGRPRVSVKRPTLNMRVNAEVLEAFKATGAGWQTRINAVLRDAVAHGVTKVP